MPIHPLPVSKIELHIKCNNLLNKDVTSKSDPCAVLFLQDREKWYEHGRTENIKNCLNPKFAKSFELDYYFETVQNLRILVYDIDNKTENLSDDDFLGSIECTLGQIVSGSPYTQPLAIKKGHQAGKGTITISAIEMEGVNEVLTMTFSAKKLDNKDFLGKSDPYLEFSRQVPDGSWLLVHRTEVVKNNLNPSWRPFIIKAQKLSGGNYEKPIKVAVYDYDSDESDLIGEFTVTILDIKTAAEQQVDCFDYDSDGSHDFIGSFTTTVLEMMEASQKQTSWECINPKKKAKKKHYTSSGIVHLTSCKVTHEYSFLDFIFGGLQINFTVAFDFTASNGDPTSPQSLHYIDAYKPNEYCKAVTSVGAVIQDYDSDKMFPALGFGARIPPNMDVSHEFAINFNPQNPFCTGIDGVLNAYKMCIQQVDLYGPTNFSPIINHVGRFAAAAKAEPVAKNYFILLILTDGVITDMDATRTAIVTASELPMSIIIVGIGTADFTAMNILDGDDGVLKAPSGRTAARDIVQFVPFRDFVDGPSAVLAKHVLAEVPQQVTEYYSKAGIAPSPRRKAPAEGQPPVPAGQPPVPAGQPPVPAGQPPVPAATS